MTSKSNETESSKALKALLDAKGVTQSAAAEAAGMSQPLMNQYTRGVRTPSGEWINLIATALELSKKQRVELHRAAAKDKGYDIDI